VFSQHIPLIGFQLIMLHKINDRLTRDLELDLTPVDEAAMDDFLIFVYMMFILQRSA
jgi:hypothetical protein